VEVQTRQTYQRKFLSVIHVCGLHISSSYLLKPHDTTWKEGIIALEAGAHSPTTFYPSYQLT